MKIRNISILLLLILLGNIVVNAQRDPYLWPFSKTSIWNMSLHRDAEFVHAGLWDEYGHGMLCDEDYLLLTPDAPLSPIYTNYTGWIHHRSRCEKEGPLLLEAPIPEDFVLCPNNWLGETPNGGVSILMPDKTTIIQTHPFARCEAGSYATSRYVWPGMSIYGHGIDGNHGGSHLSGIGGTIRLGELVPGGRIRHAMKMNVYAGKYLYYDEEHKGCRWPALTSDGYAPSYYGKSGNPVKEMRMGALLALKPDLDLATLDFETGSDGPAMILAKAYQDYGAYIVDDTYWDVVALLTEFSDKGRVLDEFERTWGFPFESSKNTPFGRDMIKIFERLHVVVNNTAETIAGGPTNDLANRRAKPACDFGLPGSGLMCPDSSRYIPLTAINIHPRELTLKLNDKFTFKKSTDPRTAWYTNARWESDNENIAIVDQNGVVEAKTQGETIIRVISLDGGRIDECKLSVKNDIPEIKTLDELGKTKIPSVKVGEFLGGGIVYHTGFDSLGREFVLIAALSDINEQGFKWGPDVATGAKSLDNGEENTQKIIATIGKKNESAALLCQKFKSGKYGDWYLPSVFELTLLWKQRDMLNEILENYKDAKTNGFKSMGYLSSTEAHYNEAWMEFFPNDFVGYYRKDLYMQVRPIKKIIFTK